MTLLYSLDMHTYRAQVLFLQEKYLFIVPKKLYNVVTQAQCGSVAAGHRPLIRRNLFFFCFQFPQISILVVKMCHQHPSPFFPFLKQAISSFKLLSLPKPNPLPPGTVKYNDNGDQGSIFPVIPDDYNLILTIKKTSKVTLQTSEVLFNDKIFSQILIYDFIHFPSVLITISST